MSRDQPASTPDVMAMALHKPACRINSTRSAPSFQWMAGSPVPSGSGLARQTERRRITTMALSARNQLLLPDEPVLRVLDESDHNPCDLARDLDHGSAYNQQAFRYFLGHERRRSELSNRPFLLLLVDLQQSYADGRIEPAIAGRLFAGLFDCLRDTDVIGWYHEGRVAGAVLTHVEDASSQDVSAEIRQRVRALLSNQLPSSIAARLQVRVYQLPAGLPQ
jgi:hypothetical protein